MMITMLRPYLIFVLISFSSFVFGQTEDDFEVGKEHLEKKVALQSGSKTASMFLDGQLVGNEKAKVKLYSDKGNLLVTVFDKENRSVDQLGIAFTPDEFSPQPQAIKKANKQKPDYFDSLFVSINYDLAEDQFFGWNQKTELFWQSPTKSLLTSNNRYFSNHQRDFINLYGIPAGNFGYDTATFDYQLTLTVNEVLVNVQDEMGYVHVRFTAEVCNKKNEEIYTKKVFGVHAEETPVYRFKKGVALAFEMGVIELMNDKQFIESIKRTTPREYKKKKPVIVAKVESKKPVVSDTLAQKGFPEKYMKACARLKTDKGLFVGVVIADAGYLLTNKNMVGDAKEIYVKVKGQKTVKGKVLRVGAKTGVVLVQILANKKFRALDLAKEAPPKNDTIYSVMPGKKYTYKKGVYQNEVAVFGNFYHTAKLVPGKSTDGTPVLNEKGEIIGILDNSVVGNSKQQVEFIIPIQDALDDLNLKLE